MILPCFKSFKNALYIAVGGGGVLAFRIVVILYPIPVAAVRSVKNKILPTPCRIVAPSVRNTPPKMNHNNIDVALRATSATKSVRVTTHRHNENGLRSTGPKSSSPTSPVSFPPRAPSPSSGADAPPVLFSLALASASSTLRFPPSVDVLSASTIARTTALFRATSPPTHPRVAVFSVGVVRIVARHRPLICVCILTAPLTRVVDAAIGAILVVDSIATRGVVLRASGRFVRPDVDSSVRVRTRRREAGTEGPRSQ